MIEIIDYDYIGSFVADIQRDQSEAAARGVLLMWRIYDSPADYPHEFVVRKLEVVGNDEPIATQDVGGGGDPEIFREVFKRAGLRCIPRQDADNPTTVETWA